MKINLGCRSQSFAARNDKKEGDARLNSFIESEKRLNDRYLNYRKKIFCRKQQIPLNNFYEKTFTLLNTKISNEVVIDNQASAENNKDQNSYSVEQFQKMYRRSSDHVFRLLKERNSVEKTGQASENAIVKEIRTLNLRKIAEKREKHTGKRVLTKIYDFDEDLKANILMKRRMSHLHNYTNQVITKLNMRNGESPYANLKIDQINKKAYAQSYSRNAYLASLNLNFRNPII